MTRLAHWILTLCLLALPFSGANALSVDDMNGSVSPAPSKRPARQAAPAQKQKAVEKSRRSLPRFQRERSAEQTTKSLRLASGSALVIDQTDGSLVFGKNVNLRQPIASITKLMTAMVVLDAMLPLDERIRISEDDVDRLKFSVSRLKVGLELTRYEMIQLALMSSENRAASALGRNYPGGTSAFVKAMNDKAQMLGMEQSRFADASGLSELNISTATDLAKMVSAAYGYEIIRQVSTAPSYIVASGHYRPTLFRNTNVLVRNGNWDIGLSKTGFIREAGHCLVMQTQISSRNLIIVLLDSQGKMSRIGDANRIKKWLERSNPTSARL